MINLFRTIWMHIIATSALFAQIEVYSNTNLLSLSDTPFLFHMVVYIVCGIVMNAFYEKVMQTFFKIKPSLEDAMYGGGFGGLLAPIIALMPQKVVMLYTYAVITFLVCFIAYFIYKKVRK